MVVNSDDSANGTARGNRPSADNTERSIISVTRDASGRSLVEAG